MPTHKITNEFIRKYNKAFAIKRYSKLPISEKIALVRKHVDKVGGAMKTEWDGIMSSTKTNTRAPKGSHKMPDGSIMKDSAMKKKRQLSSAPNLVKGLEKKKAPKPVYKLKSPRPVGAVARPNRKNRPGAPNSGALGGLTEPKFKSTPKATPTINTPKAPPPAPTRIGATGRPMKGGRSVDSVLRGRARARANKPTTTQALLKMPQDVGNIDFTYRLGGNVGERTAYKTNMNDFVDLIAKIAAEGVEYTEKRLRASKTMHAGKSNEAERIAADMRVWPKALAKAKLIAERGITPKDMKILIKRINMSPLKTIDFQDDHLGGGNAHGILAYGETLVYVVEENGKVNKRKVVKLNFPYPEGH